MDEQLRSKYVKEINTNIARSTVISDDDKIYDENGKVITPIQTKKILIEEIISATCREFR